MNNDYSELPKKTVISTVLSIPFILCFSAIMLSFDIIQRLLFFLGKGFLSFLSFSVSYLVLLSLKIFTHLKINYPKIPNDLEGPILIISNHQSLMDIAIIYCMFRKFRPQFIAKKELAKWIPFSSFNLRHKGHILIDRANGAEAMEIISSAAKKIFERKEALVLFPEGTRAREGKIKKFKMGGFKAISNIASGVTVVPLAISGAFKISYFKLMPVPFGIKVKVELGEIKKISDDAVVNESYFKEIETWIKKQI